MHFRFRAVCRALVVVRRLYEDEPVGTVALIPMGDGRYELAKMAVTDRAQGKGIGWALGRAVIDRARSLGATAVYLETNSILEPAVNLYRKLGFEDVAGGASPYCRCNVQMELPLASHRVERAILGSDH